jgi:transcription elongation factor
MKKQTRPLEKNDIVRVINGQGTGWTGVVNRIDGDSVSVFVTQNNNFATWFSLEDLKRIARIRNLEVYQ